MGRADACAFEAADAPVCMVDARMLVEEEVNFSDDALLASFDAFPAGLACAAIDTNKLSVKMG